MNQSTKLTAFEATLANHLNRLPAGTPLGPVRDAFLKGWQAAALLSYEACRDNRHPEPLVIVGQTIDEPLRSIVARECAALVAIRCTTGSGEKG